ncbi:MAG: hypothetical protein ACTSU4_00600 [Promethearchaeota archaeon]
MRDARIITIDKRGRIVIPNIVRKSLGIMENAQLMMIADSESREIKIFPIGFSEDSKPIRCRITMEDTPGALGKIATVFGNKGLSMMYCDAVIVEKNKTAILTVIFEYKQGVNLEELKKALFEKGGALNIEMESTI